MTRVNATSAGVRVQGLNELNRALRRIGPGAQRALKDAGREVAETVANDARGIAYGLGGVAAKTAPSVRAAARNTGAGVSFGGAGYPFGGGAEFGSIKYKQFKPWRGNGSNAGYFVYEAIRDNAERIEEEYTEALDQLTRRVGLR